ncbi:MAG: LysR family transcriptional regulator [Gammaproteobacteria bacterium]|nr:LysR family transcriptional regulator [Gammaproteobacteria bacterium]NNJ78452.1 LysR family transcriptional regulator [Xanthomonadales bacterium]
MNLKNIDLNLLVYLDVLLQKRNVTRSAESLGISQPAMSNGLQRLRKLFNDPLLVRTGNGMSPTERAERLKPIVRDIVASVEKAVEPEEAFDATRANRVFRLSVSDYTESTLVPLLLRHLRSRAPNVTLDFLTPSDVTFDDLGHGNVDMVINRFEELPESLHQRTVWRDGFSCLCSRHNPIRYDFDLENYLAANHVWVSKTGMGVGVGVEPNEVQQLGWVDDALSRIGRSRRIRVFTRHYQAAMKLAEMRDLVVTLPSKAARLAADNPDLVILEPPFEIPDIELTMAWSPLLHHNPAHRWLRGVIVDRAREMEA